MSSRRSQQANEISDFYGGAFVIACILVALWLFQGCATGLPPQRAQCDERKVAEFTARCAAQVRLLCDPDPTVHCAAEEVCERDLCGICPLADGCEP